MAQAGIDEVTTALGRAPVSDLEAAQWEWWLGGVERLIARRYDVAAMAADPDTRDALLYVEAEVVARKARNPEGKVSEDIDDYRYRLGTDAAAAELTITPGEWDQLAPPPVAYGVARLPGAYSVPLGWPMVVDT